MSSQETLEETTCPGHGGTERDTETRLEEPRTTLERVYKLSAS